MNYLIFGKAERDLLEAGFHDLEMIWQDGELISIELKHKPKKKYKGISWVEDFGIERAICDAWKMALNAGVLTNTIGIKNIRMAAACAVDVEIKAELDFLLGVYSYV